MSTYPLTYSGNKYNEINKYLLNMYDYNKYDYIAEPFGGIFGFSRAIAAVNDHCIFLINDINKDLIKVHNFFKKKINLKNFIKKCKSIISNTKASNDSKLLYKLKNSKKNDIEHIFLRIYATHAFYVKAKKKMLELLDRLEDIIMNIRNILDRCIFFNMDYMDFCNKMKKINNILFFFDPPYFNSNNMQYTSLKKNKNKIIFDNTEFYINILDFMETSSKDCILILNKIAIFDFLYEPFYVDEYNMVYQKTKNKTNHVIYSNI